MQITQNRNAGLRHAALLSLLPLLLASCASPTAVAIPTASAPTPAATSTARVTHAPEIRFALIGPLKAGNVWALFDSTGYSYNNYAIESGYWPRLYQLTVPDGLFEPQAAAGMPSPVQAEGALFTATVPLRPDLAWTDGSPFTADDVVFTVNTALSFQLGFDWRAHYDPAWLDHAEAVDAHTVKFYFKQSPDVAAWQYGALQGPVVQRAYWAPKIAEAAAALPGAAELTRIESLNAQVAELQKRVNDLITSALTASGEQARQLQTQVQNQQGNLDQARNALTKIEGAVNGAMETGRQSLYALDAPGEPTLGMWSPAGEANGMWTNAANPAQPFGSTHFDRAVYVLYPDERAALAALADGQVNGILEPDGISPDAAHQPIAGARTVSNTNSNSQFLVINPMSTGMADPVLRRALFCSVDRAAIASSLGTAPLSSFVPDSIVWTDPAASVPCGEGYDPLAAFDPAKAVNILKAAGYRWQSEPAAGRAGVGLTQPDGQAIPPVVMLAPTGQADPQAASAAHALVSELQTLGLSVSLQSVTPGDIRYALFNDHHYDMAVVGWRLSIYPGYLCDWFGEGNPFGYDMPQVSADCATLSATSYADAARQLVFDIQSALAQEPPFIPLYSGITYDSTRGIAYPFDRLLNGLSGAYGAPSLAAPAAP